MSWLNDLTQLDDQKHYLVCPINARADGTLYLGHPSGFKAGWQAKQLLNGCYAAIELPPWTPPERKSS